MDKQRGILSLPVIVGALGFFVDVYDLLLFNIIRKPSLQSLGLSADGVLTTGENILSIQMVGILLGGIAWGILGDKKGRKSVLFGSILLYSIATVLNGMVTNITQYTICRFVAGLGLAGESRCKHHAHNRNSSQRKTWTGCDDNCYHGSVWNHYCLFCQSMVS